MTLVDVQRTTLPTVRKLDPRVVKQGAQGLEHPITKGSQGWAVVLNNSLI